MSKTGWTHVGKWMLACAVALPLVSAEDRPTRGDRPDVLMIAVDDLRPLLGCYGFSKMHTPNIDRLARRAVVFEHAYCQYAKCGTSRLSMMTGLRPDSIGVFSNHVNDVRRFRRQHPDVSSLSRWLTLHGYHTQGFGKIDHDGWHDPDEWSVPPAPGRPKEILEIVDPAQPAGPTILAERFSCPAIQSPDVPDEALFAGRMTAQVVQVIGALDRNRPSFLAVGYRRPHLPLVAPQRYFDQYDVGDSLVPPPTPPPSDSPILAWFNSDGYVGSARKAGLHLPVPPDRGEALDWNGYELRSYTGIPNHGAIPPRVQRRIVQAYAACVSYVDAQIGRLLTALDAANRTEQTMIVLWSDHGWHLGEYGGWGKMTNFEVATRIPLLIAGPGISPGRTDTLAELVDLYPTLCDLTGVPLPAHLEGESLVDALHTPDAPTQHVAASQYARYQGSYMGRAIRTARFRYVVWFQTSTGRAEHRELYDHDVDPHETVNRAKDPRYAEHMERLESLLREEYALE